MIYFDNSATSRYKPKKMLDEMVKELSDSANGGRSAHGDALKTALKISSCRSVLCDKLHRSDKYRPVRDSETRRPRGNDRYRTQRRTSSPFRAGKSGRHHSFRHKSRQKSENKPLPRRKNDKRKYRSRRAERGVERDGRNKRL